MPIKLIITEAQKNKITEELEKLSYSNWKRKNVTYRGIKNSEGALDDSEGNSGVAMLGVGLYSTKDKKMARGYGKMYALVGAIPQNPKTFNSINEWEIWYYNVLVTNYYENNLKELGYTRVDPRDFSKYTTIEAELQKMGYDGIIIKGREMVHYNPTGVRYFENERQLEQYYDNNLDTTKYKWK